MSKKIVAKANGKFFGNILKVDAESAQEIGLLIKLGAAAAGIAYCGFQLLKKILYALPTVATSQIFAVTGYSVNANGSIDLFGHCANRNKKQPKKNEDYEFVIDENFNPEANELDDKEIQKYFINLYSDLDEALKPVISNEKKREFAVHIGAQEGLWFLSNEESLDKCRKTFKEMKLSGIQENELILIIFESIYKSGVNIFSLSTAKDLFNLSFNDPSFQHRLELLKTQSFNSIPIIGQNK
jgi:hypothetical protein